jgi:hypothetical protein
VKKSAGVWGALFVLACLLAGCKVPIGTPSDNKPLNARRYLASPNLPLTGQGLVNNDIYLNNPAVTNPFSNDSPVAFVGGAVPVGTSAGVVHYVTGYGTNGVTIYTLGSSTHVMFAAASDIGTSTMHPVDWSVIKVGAVTPAGGVFTVAGHGLAAGDTVYIAASPGNGKLASGAYLVATVPSSSTFTLTGAAITAGDSINYLAKVGSNGGTAF